MNSRKVAQIAQLVYTAFHNGQIGYTEASTNLRKLYNFMSDAQQRKARDFFDANKFNAS